MHGQSAATPGLPPVPSQIVRPFDTSGGIATINVALGDAAPSFFGNRLTGINVAISEIDVVDNAGRSQVVATYSSPLMINLLQYQDGLGTSIGQASVNQLLYQQVRLVVDVGASSVLYTGGAVAPLRFVTDRDQSSAGAGSATSTTVLDSGHVAITDSRPFSIGSTINELVNVDFNLIADAAVHRHGARPRQQTSIRQARRVSAGGASDAIRRRKRQRRTDNRYDS